MMNFQEWCQLDMQDTRKINYELLRDGKVEHLTSDDEVDYLTMCFVRGASIEFLKLFHNEWFVILRWR